MGRGRCATMIRSIRAGSRVPGGTRCCKFVRVRTGKMSFLGMLQGAWQLLAGPEAGSAFPGSAGVPAGLSGGIGGTPAIFPAVVSGSGAEGRPGQGGDLPSAEELVCHPPLANGYDIRTVQASCWVTGA